MEGRRLEGEGTTRNVPRLAHEVAVGKSAADVEPDSTTSLRMSG